MKNPTYEIPQWALTAAIEGLQELYQRLEYDAAAFAKLDSAEGRLKAQERLEKAWEYQKAHEFFLGL